MRSSWHFKHLFKYTSLQTKAGQYFILKTYVMTKCNVNWVISSYKTTDIYHLTAICSALSIIFESCRSIFWFDRM